MFIVLNKFPINVLNIKWISEIKQVTQEDLDKPDSFYGEKEVPHYYFSVQFWESLPYRKNDSIRSSRYSTYEEAERMRDGLLIIINNMISELNHVNI